MLIIRAHVFSIRARVTNPAIVRSCTVVFLASFLEAFFVLQMWPPHGHAFAAVQ